jgi:putative FmdB family regulatory protein
MPLYAFKCTECEHEFDVLNSIDERHKPLSEPCPHCGALDSIKSVLTPTRIVATTMTNLKPPDGFRDLLRHIKKGSGSQSNIEI